MLEINPDKVCYIIVKAREFDAKVEVVEPNPGSNPSDEGMREVLEDYRDDPVAEELTGFIGSLNEDERIDLVALAWLGRGTFDDWDSARKEARRHGAHRRPLLAGRAARDPQGPAAGRCASVGGVVPQ